jgi:SAM-dependent methyltransferase
MKLLNSNEHIRDVAEKYGTQLRLKAELEVFEVVLACPLCGGCDFRYYEKSEWRFSGCKTCGMSFLYSYMTPETIALYYKKLYRSCVPPYEEEVTAKQVSEETKSAERYKKYANSDMAHHITPPKRHLDIGSSTGSFLKVMQDAYGCESVGVEPGDKFRKYSNERGIETVANIREVEGKFDFISMCQVLEHMPKPMDELALIRDLLEDDGRLLIEVPYMMAAYSHPLMFNEDTLYKMMDKAGFEIEFYGITKRAIWVKVMKNTR